jgi:hypothetical protein
MSMEKMFNGMFGKIEAGKCRLSMNGKIAIQTSTGYKTYDVKKKKLMNCENFVLDIGDELFFVIPTNKVKIGDIILVNQKPCCVINANKDEITVLNYENSTKEIVIPERHIFMGKSYFYGKIFSPMGNMFKDGKGSNNMMKMMMMSEMMKAIGGKEVSNPFGGNRSDDSSSMSSMLSMMAMSNVMGEMGGMFDGMFDCFDDEDIEDEDVEEEDKEEEEE